jgi:hypothetical protein
MNNQTLRRSFIIFHLTLGLVVLAQSLVTVFEIGRSDFSKHAKLLVALLAGAEAVAALLFIVPATLRAGAFALLAIFFFALAFHGLHGEFPSTLLVYAAGVFFVMTHGSAFGKSAAGRGGLKSA